MSAGDFIAQPRRLRQSRAYHRSPGQEKETAARTGGRTTPGSGAFNVKGDVRIKGAARIECKTTAGKSLSISRETMDKIEQAALSSGEVPALAFEFMPVAGHPGGKYFILPDYLLEPFAEYAKTLRTT